MTEEQIYELELEQMFAEASEYEEDPDVEAMYEYFNLRRSDV